VSGTPSATNRWLSRTVLAIVLTTFFSDVSHEMATTVLPLYLASVGWGPLALGLIEGTADFLVSMSKLGGGYLGHHVQRKKPWVALGYLVTTLGTSAIGLTNHWAAVLVLRSVAWVGRGFRSPLRDYLLAGAMSRTHYGRVYGLERAGDMLGAVTGPLAAVCLLWLGLSFSWLILGTLIPGMLAVGIFAAWVREDQAGAGSQDQPSGSEDPPPASRHFPKVFWWFLTGVVLFGLGDFSRTFLVLLAARSAGEHSPTPGTFSVAVSLYLVHNLVSALTAYPVGWWSDRRAKLPMLAFGYGLGVATNLLLACFSTTLSWLSLAIVLSGVYIAIEETLEKAVAAEILPRELRSLGFGILASANAVGDMVSSFYVGALLHAELPGAAFGSAAAVGGLGFLWMLFVVRRHRPRLFAA
jgi:MFS family permease